MPQIIGAPLTPSVRCPAPSSLPRPRRPLFPAAIIVCVVTCRIIVTGPNAATIVARIVIYDVVQTATRKPASATIFPDVFRPRASAGLAIKVTIAATR